MWALDNRTPFACERTWVRDRDGAEVWLVAVKGTFRIEADGSVRLDDRQEEVLRVPRYQGEPGASALLHPEDLVHTKVATDVLLNGHAYAPKGTPARAVEVLLRVGPVRKALRVTGDRYWRVGVFGLKASEPEPFLKMPLDYGRAYGGRDDHFADEKDYQWDRRNPVGAGFGVAAEHLAGRRLPNVEDPFLPVGSWKDRPAPAGYGAVAREWLPRSKFAGTYDAEWEEKRQPLLPSDFDDRFYQAAPSDQQVPGFLKGGEEVELFNLTPGGHLRFALPRVTLNFRTRFKDGAMQEHRAVLHTVILEPDVPRVLMVWHTHLACHPRVLKLLGTSIRVKSRLEYLEGRPWPVPEGASR